MKYLLATELAHVRKSEISSSHVCKPPSSTTTFTLILSHLLLDGINHQLHRNDYKDEIQQIDDMFEEGIEKGGVMLNGWLLNLFVLRWDMTSIKNGRFNEQLKKRQSTEDGDTTGY